MGVRVRKLNDAQPPATIRFYWKDEPVELRYLPGQLTNAWRRQIGSRPVRQSLALILAGWDVEGDDGQPFQPPSASNTDHWRGVLAQADRDIDEGLLELPEGPEREQIAATYATSASRPEEVRIRDAYVAAWEKHLDEIGDTEFLIACLNGVADDFLGGAPSKKRSGSTSA